VDEVLGAVINGILEMKPVLGSKLIEPVPAFKPDRVDRVPDLKLVIRFGFQLLANDINMTKIEEFIGQKAP
jgi:hypothetical protein